MSDPRHSLGLSAEAIVATWLEGRGWTILARRWRCREGEIDLVAIDPDGALVAVEVKLRRSGRAGDPSESLDPRQVGRLRMALRRYSAESRWPARRGLRLDLVAVRPSGDGRWRLVHERAIDGW